MTSKFVEMLFGILSSDYQPPRGDKKGIFKTISSRPAADEEEAKALIQRAALAAARASLPVKQQRCAWLR